MSSVAAKLESLGLVLPQPLKIPEGVKLPFPWVSVRGDRVFVSGHGPQNLDGSLAGPFGKVGAGEREARRRNCNFVKVFLFSHASRIRSL